MVSPSSPVFTSTKSGKGMTGANSAVGTNSVASLCPSSSSFGFDEGVAEALVDVVDSLPSFEELVAMPATDGAEPFAF